MRTGNLRHLWIISFLVVFVFACRAFTGLQEDVDTARDQVESVATDIQQGRDLLGTARAIATQVGGSGLIRTAQALATQAGESGLLETAQAFATAQGPGLIETALAVATQEGPSILATAQAYITEAAPGDAPEDIPILDGDKEMFFQSSQMVSYVISLPYMQVVEYYKSQMPANGWAKEDQDWVEGETVSNLQFEKTNRRASVVVTPAPGGSKTTVLILIETK
jgi:hypothetical protein